MRSPVVPVSLRAAARRRSRPHSSGHSSRHYSGDLRVAAAVTLVAFALITVGTLVAASPPAASHPATLAADWSAHGARLLPPAPAHGRATPQRARASASRAARPGPHPQRRAAPPRPPAEVLSPETPAPELTPPWAVWRWHEVARGETLVGIATRYGIRDWRRLLSVNPEIERPDSLRIGSRLRVPYPAALQTEWDRAWRRLALCESNGNPRAISKTGLYRGAFQFDLPTWNSVGMTGDPVDYPYEVQLAAAQRLWSRRGFQPWPTCGRLLGLIRDDDGTKAQQSHPQQRRAPGKGHQPAHQESDAEQPGPEARKAEPSEAEPNEAEPSEAPARDAHSGARSV